jgi:hypothetical protein
MVLVLMGASLGGKKFYNKVDNNSSAAINIKEIPGMNPGESDATKIEWQATKALGPLALVFVAFIFASRRGPETRKWSPARTPFASKVASRPKSCGRSCGEEKET